jgi:hypothetical protein
MANLYASDLAKDKQTDAFMGEGFEEMFAKAEADGVQLIIGTILNKSDWEKN